MIDNLINYPFRINSVGIDKSDAPTIIELLHYYYGKINEVIAQSNSTLGQVGEDKTELTNYIDSVKTGINATKTELDSFMSWIRGTGINTETANVLNAMYSDGRLETLINQTLLTDINSKVDNVKLELKSTTIYEKALKDLEVLPTNSLIQAKKSIIAYKTLKVAFIGDSITEGADQLNIKDSFSFKVIDRLKKILPNINIISENFSLGGRSFEHFNNVNYTAVNPETNTNINFWRSWATVGKSWKDHIKDFSPDIIICGFGMNDAYVLGNSCYAEYSNLELFKTFINGFTKVPSIVLIPTILPTTNQNLYTQRQDVTQSIARATREFAKQNSYIIADANRLYRILRDGLEEVNRTSELVNVGSLYPTGFTGDISSFSKNGNDIESIVSISKFITYDRKFYNGIINSYLTFKATGDSGAMYIKYRDSDLGSFILSVTNTYIGLFYNTTLIASNTQNVASGCSIKIEVNGTNHIVTIDGVEKINVSTFYGLFDGKVTLGSPQTVGNFGTPNIIFNDEIKSIPMYTELDLLGEYNSSQSGNAINHPTGLGHELFYVPTFNGILKELTNPYTNKATITIQLPNTSLTYFNDNSNAQKVYYTNLTVNSNYNRNLGCFIRDKNTGEIYTFDEGIVATGGYAQLKTHQFALYSVNSNTDQLLIQCDSAIDLELFQYAII